MTLTGRDLPSTIPCRRRRALMRTAMFAITALCGVGVVWAADGKDRLADAVQPHMTVIPIRASGKEFRIQPSARTFASSKEVPLMKGRRFNLQSAVELSEDEKR